MLVAHLVGFGNSCRGGSAPATPVGGPRLPPGVKKKKSDFQKKHIQKTEKQIFKNEFSSGSAWFVKENINVFDDDQEIKSLDTLNYKEISVSQSFESKKYYNNTSSIVVAEKKSDYIRYDVSSDDTGLIIFSEIFYPKGWKAYINDQEVTMERFNYILRGLEVPKGKHRLEFVFDPTIVKLSSNISLFSTLGFVFIILVMILKRKN